MIVNASTAEGIRWLVEQEQADIVVFGSDYRTAAGHVSPQHSAEALLEGGPAAVAIAPANYRSDHISRFGRIGVLADPGDDAAIETARELGESLGARVSRDEPYVDLLVVGSRLEAPEGRVMISSAAWNAIENATSPVLVVPRGVSPFRVRLRRIIDGPCHRLERAPGALPGWPARPCAACHAAALVLDAGCRDRRHPDREW